MDAKQLLEAFTASSFRDPRKAAEMFISRSSKTGSVIHQLFVGRLEAENGEIKPLRESINLVELSLAIYPDGLADYEVPEQRVG